MNHLSEDRENLMIGKLTNTLTEEEALQVQRLIETDVEFNRAYEEFVKQFPENLVKNDFQELNESWQDLSGKLRSRKTEVFKLWKVAVAAAIVCGIIAFNVYRLVRQLIKEQKNPVSTAGFETDDDDNNEEPEPTVR